MNQGGGQTYLGCYRMRAATTGIDARVQGNGNGAYSVATVAHTPFKGHYLTLSDAYTV